MACRPRACRLSKSTPRRQFKGRYNSEQANANVPAKAGGATPTSVQGWPFTLTIFPTTERSPPNLRCQVECPRTTTGVGATACTLFCSYKASKGGADIEQREIANDAFGFSSQNCGRAGVPLSRQWVLRSVAIRSREDLSGDIWAEPIQHSRKDTTHLTWGREDVTHAQTTRRCWAMREAGN